MNESPDPVDSGSDVARGDTLERWQLEQWNWIAQARTAAARSLELIALDGPRALQGASRADEAAPVD
jgi:hypothetical protein